MKKISLDFIMLFNVQILNRNDKNEIKFLICHK